MGNRHIRVVVSANGTYRRVLGMIEQAEGSVYVRLYSGLNAGRDNYEAEIGEHRFSLHPSPELDYSVMNRHMRLKDGKEDKLASRVSAIKAGEGFSPVFCCRLTNLTHPLHDIAALKGARASKIFPDGFNFDCKNCTIFLGLFVAGVNAKFFPENSDTIYGEWVFDKLKVLILGGYSNFPATPLGRIGQSMGVIEDPDGSVQIMRPLSSSECESLFKSNMHEMQRSQLQELLDINMGDETNAVLRSLLDTLTPPSPDNPFNLLSAEHSAPK